jgi:hypothetical protein
MLLKPKEKAIVCPGPSLLSVFLALVPAELDDSHIQRQGPKHLSWVLIFAPLTS